MKIFKIFALSGLAVANSETQSSSITLNGEESLEQLDQILKSLDEDYEETQLLRSGNDNQANTRRHKHVKISMLWMLNERKFGKYTDYGCHCFLDSYNKKITSESGAGAPQDFLDQACAHLSQCYKCLESEHSDEPNECDAGARGYNVNLIQDKVTGEKSLECMDKPGRCRRNICECDRAFAYAIAAEEANWDRALLKKKGFDRDNECTASGARSLGGIAAGEFVDCCGDKDTFPFNKPRHEGQCCDGFKAKPAGTC